MVAAIARYQVQGNSADLENAFEISTRSKGGMLRDIRIAIVHCLLMGYLPAVLLYAIEAEGTNEN
mgnify:CR=1 FL=1